MSDLRQLLTDALRQVGDSIDEIQEGGEIFIFSNTFDYPQMSNFLCEYPRNSRGSEVEFPPYYYTGGGLNPAWEFPL